MGHRLTCAPIRLDPFLLHIDNTAICLNNIDRNDLDNTAWYNFSLLLKTNNGPNFLSNESSRLRMAIEHGPRDLTVLPHYLAGLETKYMPQRMHKDLAREDGTSFLVVYRPGRSRYFEMIDDPFFAAHTQDESDPSRWYPDREATALGCVEQYQYCTPRFNYCGPWGRRSLPIAEILRIYVEKGLNEEEDMTAIGELHFFIQEDAILVLRLRIPGNAD